MQNVFDENHDLLEENGIFVPNHRLTRKFLTVPCQLKAYERIGQKRKTVLSDGELKLIVGSYFEKIRSKKAKQVLISDENFLGHCGHVARSGILYSRKGQFLNVLKEQLPEHPQRIFLCYRDYKSYFSSVYVQYLLNVEETNFTPPQKFADNVIKRYPSWVSLSSTIQKIFPKSQLIVWPYEGIQSNWLNVFSAIFGEDVAKQLSIHEAKKLRPSMPDEALRDFLDLAQSRGLPTALAALPKISDEYSNRKDVSPVQIFTKEQTEILDARYSKHISKLDDAGLNLKRIL